MRKLRCVQSKLSARFSKRIAYEPETHDEFEEDAQFAHRVAPIDDEEAARELEHEHGADLQHYQQVARTQEQVIAAFTVNERT